MAFQNGQAEKIRQGFEVCLTIFGNYELKY